MIYTKSRGGANTNGLAPTYWGKDVYNSKREFSIGAREMFQPKDYLRFLFELHYSQRQDGENDWARMTKFSSVPVIVPTGERSFWARPEIRFVTSVSFYNKFAQENLYSPYLQSVGKKKVGYYFGLKAEWWLWN